MDERRYHRLHLDAARRYVDSYRRATQHPVTDGELACVRLFCVARQTEDLRQRVAALPTLPAASDDEYAALIDIRIGMMDQIRRTRDEDWIL